MGASNIQRRRWMCGGPGPEFEQGDGGVGRVVPSSKTGRKTSGWTSVGPEDCPQLHVRHRQHTASNNTCTQFEFICPRVTITNSKTIPKSGPCVACFAVEAYCTLRFPSTLLVAVTTPNVDGVQGAAHKCIVVLCTLYLIPRLDATSPVLCSDNTCILFITVPIVTHTGMLHRHLKCKT